MPQYYLLELVGCLGKEQFFYVVKVKGGTL